MRYFKGYLVLVIYFLLHSCCSESPSDEPLLNLINESGKVMVGFEPDAPPIYFEDSAVKKGIEYELLKYLAENTFAHVKINTIEKSFDELPEELRSGRIQIMAGGRTYTGSKEELCSQSYLSFGYALVTSNSNADKFKSLTDLIAARIGVYDEGAEQWLRSKIPTAQINIIGSLENENTPESDWMSAIIDGQVDAVVYDFPFAAVELGDYDDKLTITNSNLNGNELSEYVLIINKRAIGSKELMDSINVGIQNFKKTSAFSDAVNRYIPFPNKSPGMRQGALEGYAIQTGETLSTLARDHLGDVHRWREIYSLNSDVLASPDIVFTGQVIKKPAGWR